MASLARGPSRASVPRIMRDAWHVDVHRGGLLRRLDPHEMVGAVFGLALAPLVPGDEVHTMFGKFTADEVRSEPDRSFALLSTWAPGSTSRFALEARRCSGGVWEVVLTNSVHPSGWIGRAYFRAIQVGHEVVMRVALRRLARVAGPATGSPGP